jgi:hypothetical protein
MTSSTDETFSLPLIVRQGESSEGNTPFQSALVVGIELIRIGGTIASIVIGFAGEPRPNYRLSAALLVFFLAGVTGLESLFLPDISAKAKNWPTGSPYQVQSGINNLSSAVVMIILLSIEASDAAIATLMLVVITFIALSGINHVTTAMRDKWDGKEVAKIHYERFIFAIPLTVVAALILHNWKPFS